MFVHVFNSLRVNFMIMTSNLKDQFKQLLENHGLNINKLAVKIGENPQTLHGWFRRNGIPVKRCGMLAVAIGCRVEDLQQFADDEIPISIPAYAEELSNEKKLLLEVYDRMDPEEQKAIISEMIQKKAEESP